METINILNKNFKKESLKEFASYRPEFLLGSQRKFNPLFFIGKSRKEVNRLLRIFAKSNPKKAMFADVRNIVEDRNILDAVKFENKYFFCRMLILNNIEYLDLDNNNKQLRMKNKKELFDFIDQLYCVHKQLVVGIKKSSVTGKQLIKFARKAYEGYMIIDLELDQQIVTPLFGRSIRKKLKTNKKL